MRITFVLLAALAVLFPVHAQQRYSFTKIADSSDGDFERLGQAVAINNRGRVVFAAAPIRSGGFGVYSGDGGPLTTIVPPNTRNLGAVSSINDAGVVALTADDLPNGVLLGIYHGDGGLLRPILEVNEDSDFGFDPTTAPSINESGATSFAGIVDSGAVIFVADENGIRPVAFSFDEASSTPLPGVAINENEEVAFARIFPPSFLKAKDGEITVLSDEDDGTVFVQITNRPAINDPGAVAFVDYRRTGVAVLVAQNGEQTVIAHESNGYPGLGPVSINNAGVVAFHGWTDRFTRGIYTGADSMASKVIETGDELFGGEVSSIDLAPISTEFLNDMGQIVFAYSIYDPERGNVEGIAVATPGAVPPALSEGAIVNAASFSSPSAPDGAPAPGAMVSIYGSEFADKLTVAAGSPLPTELDRVRVEFGGVPAPLFFTSSGQINAQLPYEIPVGTTTARVATSSGLSEARSLSVAALSPAIYTLSQNGGGQAIVVFADTGAIAGPLGATPTSQPARAGDVLTIYANGLGAVDPPIESGRNSCDPDGVCAPDFSNLVLRRVRNLPTLEIGGIAVPPENITFAGLAPQFVGLYQINFILPDGILPGDARPLVIRQRARGQVETASRADVTLAVR